MEKFWFDHGRISLPYFWEELSCNFAAKQENELPKINSNFRGVSEPLRRCIKNFVERSEFNNEVRG